uniref:Putative secreted salivary gland peptide n=2 Tax=Ixodes ricinus TaxID=34613 RepID=A0A090XBC9_IXORI
MLRFMTLLLAASTFGNGATVHDFNDYVDRAVGSTLPPLIRNAHSIYPEARIPFPHIRAIGRVRLAKRHRSEADRGGCEGYWTSSRERSGSCSHPSQVMGATVTTCTLDLSGLEATYTLRTKQREHIFAKRKTFSVDVRVASATASIVLASNGDQNPRLVSFHLNHIGFVMSYDRDFDLDASRQKKFGEEVFDYTRSELTKIIEGSYFTALSQAFANTCFACR